VVRGAAQLRGIYAGTIAIGGLIERSDIHKATLNSTDLSAGMTAGTLDPDELAETLWQLYSGQERGGRQCLRHLTYLRSGA
jgi:hypothetical protein